MANLITSKQDHIERTNEWKARIDDMEYFNVKAGFFSLERRQNKNMDVNAKYDRFIEFTREWMYGILTNDQALGSVINPSEFGGFQFKRNQLGDNWWKNAIKAGSGKAVTDGLPSGIHTSEADKDKIYDKFMPAYRALRDRFEKRRWYEWIFNHAQYTAERDAMKAIRGVMMSLTGDNREAFDTNYNAYHENVNLNEVFADNPDAIENDVVGKEKIEINENDLQANVNKEQKMFDKTDKIVNAEMFHTEYNAKLNKLIDQIVDISKLDPQTIMPQARRFNDVYPRLVQRLADDAMNISYQYDNLKEQGANDSEIANMIKENAKDMFKNAFLRLNINLPLKERILVAQFITDQVLVSATPAGFEAEKFARFASMYALRSPGCVKDAIAELGNKLQNSEMINNADAVIEEIKKDVLTMEIDKTNEVVNCEKFYTDYTESLNSIIDQAAKISKLDTQKLMPEADRFEKVYNSLISGLGEDALNISYQYDKLIYKGAKTPELANVFKNGAKEMFKNAFMKLTPINLPVKEQIEVAQIITDRVLMSATAAGFDSATFGRYTNMYALRSPKFIKDVIIELGTELNNIDMINNVDAIVEEVRNEMLEDEADLLEESILLDDDDNVSEFIQGDEGDEKDNSIQINT
jgi:hypothetical protein